MKALSQGFVQLLDIGANDQMSDIDRIRLRIFNLDVSIILL